MELSVEDADLNIRKIETQGLRDEMKIFTEYSEFMEAMGIPHADRSYVKKLFPNEVENVLPASPRSSPKASKKDHKKFALPEDFPCVQDDARMLHQVKTAEEMKKHFEQRHRVNFAVLTLRNERFALIKNVLISHRDKLVTHADQQSSHIVSLETELKKVKEELKQITKERDKSALQETDDGRKGKRAPLDSNGLSISTQKTRRASEAGAKEPVSSCDSPRNAMKLSPRKKQIIEMEKVKEENSALRSKLSAVVKMAQRMKNTLVFVQTNLLGVRSMINETFFAHTFGPQDDWRGKFNAFLWKIYPQLPPLGGVTISIPDKGIDKGKPLTIQRTKSIKQSRSSSFDIGTVLSKNLNVCPFNPSDSISWDKVFESLQRQPLDESEVPNMITTVFQTLAKLIQKQRKSNLAHDKPVNYLIDVFQPAQQRKKIAAGNAAEGESFRTIPEGLCKELIDALMANVYQEVENNRVKGAIRVETGKESYWMQLVKSCAFTENNENVREVMQKLESNIPCSSDACDEIAGYFKRTSPLIEDLITCVLNLTQPTFIDPQQHIRDLRSLRLSVMGIAQVYTNASSQVEDLLQTIQSTHDLAKAIAGEMTKKISFLRAESLCMKRRILLPMITRHRTIIEKFELEKKNKLEAEKYEPLDESVVCVWMNVPAAKHAWRNSLASAAKESYCTTAIELAQASHGYVTFTEYDVMQILFKDISNAIVFCNNIHMKFMQMEWPSDVLDTTIFPKGSHADTVCGKGLMVRLSIHSAPTKITKENGKIKTLVGAMADCGGRVALLIKAGETGITGPAEELIPPGGKKSCSSFIRSGFVKDEEGQIVEFTVFYPKELEGRYDVLRQYEFMKPQSPISRRDREMDSIDIMVDEPPPKSPRSPMAKEGMLSDRIASMALLKAESARGKGVKHETKRPLQGNNTEDFDPKLDKKVLRAPLPIYISKGVNTAPPLSVSTGVNTASYAHLGLESSPNSGATSIQLVGTDVLGQTEWGLAQSTLNELMAQSVGFAHFHEVMNGTRSPRKLQLRTIPRLAPSPAVIHFEMAPKKPTSIGIQTTVTIESSSTQTNAMTSICKDSQTESFVKHSSSTQTDDSPELVDEMYEMCYSLASEGQDESIQTESFSKLIANLSYREQQIARSRFPELIGPQPFPEVVNTRDVVGDGKGSSFGPAHYVPGRQDVTSESFANLSFRDQMIARSRSPDLNKSVTRDLVGDGKDRSFGSGRQDVTSESSKNLNLGDRMVAPSRLQELDKSVTRDLVGDGSDSSEKLNLGDRMVAPSRLPELDESVTRDLVGDGKDYPLCTCPLCPAHYVPGRQDVTSESSKELTLGDQMVAPSRFPELDKVTRDHAGGGKGCSLISVVSPITKEKSKQSKQNLCDEEDIVHRMNLHDIHMAQLADASSRDTIERYGRRKHALLLEGLCYGTLTDYVPPLSRGSTRLEQQQIQILRSQRKEVTYGQERVERSRGESRPGRNALSPLKYLPQGLPTRDHYLPTRDLRPLVRSPGDHRAPHLM